MAFFFGFIIFFDILKKFKIFNDLLIKMSNYSDYVFLEEIFEI